MIFKNINLIVWQLYQSSIVYYDTKAVTPGQAAVFYMDEVCIGSAIIDEVYNDNKKLKL